jgi:hypothetical protein
MLCELRSQNMVKENLSFMLRKGRGTARLSLWFNSQRKGSPQNDATGVFSNGKKEFPVIAIPKQATPGTA